MPSGHDVVGRMAVEPQCGAAGRDPIAVGDLVRVAPEVPEQVAFEFAMRAKAGHFMDVGMGDIVKIDIGKRGARQVGDLLERVAIRERLNFV